MEIRSPCQLELELREDLKRRMTPFDLTFDEIATNIPEADMVYAQGNPLNPSSAAYMLMNSEVLIPQGEDVRLAKVIRKNVDSDGKVLGDYNNIPILNTILYDVQFPDGAINT